MINIEEGKTRRDIDIPCQTCGNPTSFRIEFAHNENPNAKTSIHICRACIKKLQKLLAKTLKDTPEKLAEQNDQLKHKKDQQPISKSNLTLKAQIRLWEEFSDFEIDDNERITKPFIHKPYLAFPAGTHREEIWHWFEDNGPLSAYQLLYEIDDFKK